MKMKNDYKKRNQVLAGSAAVFFPVAAVRVATLNPPSNNHNIFDLGTDVLSSSCE
jgi:hypothetical protein